MEVETREVQTGCKEKSVHHQDREALEKVVKRGCAASILRGFQNLVWSKTWSHAALTRKLD